MDSAEDLSLQLFLLSFTGTCSLPSLGLKTEGGVGEAGTSTQLFTAPSVPGPAGKTDVYIDHSPVGFMTFWPIPWPRPMLRVQGTRMYTLDFCVKLATPSRNLKSR
jgi:hypothetical protein